MGTAGRVLLCLALVGAAAAAGLEVRPAASAGTDARGLTSAAPFAESRPHFPRPII